MGPWNILLLNLANVVSYNSRCLKMQDKLQQFVLCRNTKSFVSVPVIRNILKLIMSYTRGPLYHYNMYLSYKMSNGTKKGKCELHK